MKRQEKLRIALAQLNLTVGNLEGNSAKILEYIQRAKALKTDIIVFPELSITGYPPEDLLCKKKFIDDNLKTLKEITSSVDDIVAIIGFIDRKKQELYNSLAVIYRKKVKGVYHKMLLPNYGVFDEKRYFKQGGNVRLFNYAGIVFGVNICEDIWYQDGPLEKQARLGANLIFNSNASPYHAGRIKERVKIVSAQAKKHKVFICYTNLIGGQDELVFDGQSLIIDNKGKLLSMAQAFEDDLLVYDLKITKSSKKAGSQIIKICDKVNRQVKPVINPKKIKSLSAVGEIYQALLLGLKDYPQKNGFKKVILGLSGGIDSALVATLAADALGKDNVTAVFMPSRYSSKESESDSRELAKNLGIKFLVCSIEEIYKMYLTVLEKHFFGLSRDITEENIQARIRGNIVMAFSNKFGWLVLTTGNKSEMSTGYATLYGDMAGGFAVIKDVPKTLVYKLAKYRNSLKPVIPENSLVKAPTAELRPNQKDADSLPEYEILDPILRAYVEEDKSFNEIVSLGFDKQTVEKVINLVDRSEYKRRQAPPGIKITPKAFGRDRRMPITNQYKFK